MPAGQKPQPIATGRIASRYRPVSATGSMRCCRAAIASVTAAIAAAPATRPAAARRIRESTGRRSRLRLGERNEPSLPACSAALKARRRDAEDAPALGEPSVIPLV